MRSILEELDSFHLQKDKSNIVESRATHVIQGAINLVDFIRENYTQEQADELVRLLQHALDNSMNVLVHCHAGICRSGSVVEVGQMMGFTPTERFRMPNLRVKHFMMKSLGLTYDSAEKTSWTNGWVSESGIVMPNGDFE